LGLSIVDLVLERIGGRLELVNEADGGLRATMHFRVGSLRSSGGEL
jgi:C4-dicarboxylate-specific signal transduction histidine kinase